MKKIALLAAVMLTITGCAGLSAPPYPDEDSAAAAIGAANDARKKAASVGGEWRDTGKFIKQAKAAAADGDYEKAIKLANKAKTEGELGYAQAISQKDAGPWSF